MHYLFAVIADLNKPVNASPEEAIAIDAFNDKIEVSGNRVMAVGVAAPDTAKVFDNRGGLGLMQYGPVVDADLFMAGFWIIEAENDAVVDQLATEASLACNRIIEVRRLLS